MIVDKLIIHKPDSEHDEVFTVGSNDVTEIVSCVDQGIHFYDVVFATGTIKTFSGNLGFVAFKHKEDK